MTKNKKRDERIINSLRKEVIFSVLKIIQLNNMYLIVKASNQSWETIYLGLTEVRLLPRA